MKRLVKLDIGSGSYLASTTPSPRWGERREAIEYRTSREAHDAARMVREYYDHGIDDAIVVLRIRRRKGSR